MMSTVCYYQLLCARADKAKLMQMLPMRKNETTMLQAILLYSLLAIMQTWQCAMFLMTQGIAGTMPDLTVV